LYLQLVEMRKIVQSMMIQKMRKRRLINEDETQTP
jgi:hypothetical protein